MVLDHSKIFFRSSRGTPSNSAIACNGSSQATSVTKSPVPDSIAARTTRSARSVSSPKPADRPGREPARDDAAQLGVLGRVDVEHDQPLQGEALLGLDLAEPDDRGVLPAPEQVSVPRDLHGPPPSACDRGPGSSPSACSATTRTTTWTARSPPPSGCCGAAACRSATSTFSRSTRPSRRSCCPG